MKLATIALVLSTSFTAFAGNELVLQKVDALLADETYEAALKCGDEARTSSFLVDFEPSFEDHKVVKCGAVTVIESSDGETTESSMISRENYLSLKGNPLRAIAEGFVGKSRFSEDFRWVSASPLTIDHLGVKRTALLVKGEGEVCFDTDEGEACVDVNFEVTVAQGVPWLARIAAISSAVNGETFVRHDLISFSRKL